MGYKLKISLYFRHDIWKWYWLFIPYFSMVQKSVHQWPLNCKLISAQRSVRRRTVCCGEENHAQLGSPPAKRLFCFGLGYTGLGLASYLMDLNDENW